MTTAEAAALRFRVGRRGVVHEARPGETMTARCGVLVATGEPTNDPATCRTCLGQRVWRGGPRRRAAVKAAAALLRLTDRALAALEDAIEAAGDAWRAGRSGPLRMNHGGLPVAPPGTYGPPPQAVLDLVAELRRQYEPKRPPSALRDTVAAHEELLRLQSYLLPDGDREDP